MGERLAEPALSLHRAVAHSCSYSVPTHAAIRTAAAEVAATLDPAAGAALMAAACAVADELQQRHGSQQPELVPASAVLRALAAGGGPMADALQPLLQAAAVASSPVAPEPLAALLGDVPAFDLAAGHGLPAQLLGGPARAVVEGLASDDAAEVANAAYQLAKAMPGTSPRQGKAMADIMASVHVAAGGGAGAVPRRETNAAMVQLLKAVVPTGSPGRLPWAVKRALDPTAHAPKRLVASANSLLAPVTRAIKESGGDWRDPWGRAASAAHAAAEGLAPRLKDWPSLGPGEKAAAAAAALGQAKGLAQAGDLGPAEQALVRAGDAAAMGDVPGVMLGVADIVRGVRQALSAGGLPHDARVHAALRDTANALGGIVAGGGGQLGAACRYAALLGASEEPLAAFAEACVKLAREPRPPAAAAAAAAACAAAGHQPAADALVAVAGELGKVGLGWLASCVSCQPPRPLLYYIP